MSIKYEPLNVPGLAEDELRIRVLELQPVATSGEKVQCYIRHASLQERFEYEALSYVWGNPGDTVNVEVNKAVAAVTRNLYHALRGLRLEAEGRTLWVDALCINQADTREKEQQVQLMRQIYQQCQRVLIWLGEDKEKDSGPAMRLIKILSEISRNHEIPNMPNLDLRTLQRYGVPSLFDRSHNHLMEVAKRPWFQRAWIVQEALLPPAARLYWGHETSEIVDWDDLVSAVKVGFLLKLPFAYHPAFSSMKAIVDARDEFRRGLRKPFLDTLVAYQRAHATEPRDKVFAFLGLASAAEAKALAIKVKYSGALAPIFEVVARSIILHERSLRILSVKASLPPSRQPGLPSWVPDWSAASQHTSLPLVSDCVPLVTLTGDDMFEPFNAAGRSDHVSALTVSPRCLKVEGLVVDQVDFAGSVFSGYPLPSDLKGLLKAVRIWAKTWGTLPEWEHIVSQNETYVTGEEMPEVFWRTLCCNCIRRSESVDEVRQDFANLLNYHRRVAAPARVPLLGPVLFALLALWAAIRTYVLRSPIQTFAQNRCGGIVGRRLVLTRRGFIGIAAPNTSVDDNIAIVRGSTVPLVIRKEDDASWRFVGDAYVHGLMSGEAFDQDGCRHMDLR